MDDRNSQIAWLQRPLAVLAVVPFVRALPSETVDLIASALLLAHYLSALLFHPWEKIARAGNLAPHLALLALLAAISHIQFIYGLPNILLFFGLHFVFTELYDGRATEAISLRTARGVYYGAGYLFFLRWNLGFEAWGAGFLSVSLAALVFTLVRSPRRSDRVSEASFLVGLAAAYYQPMRFSYVLLYHVMVWWAIPLVRGYKVTPGKYLGVTTVLSVVFLAVVLGTTAKQEALYWIWRRETIRFGYLHVALSFIMSNLNPAMVRNGALRAQRILANVVSFG